MSVNKEKYQELIAELNDKATLVAVSKTKPAEEIQSLYDLGQRDFGENYVQEMVDKHELLSKDIRWHFIGHLQSNKVKYIAPFVHLIHGVDSEKLLSEINKQAKKLDKKIHCLLQVHIAKEETKFGFDEDELKELITRIKNQSCLSADRLHEFENVKIEGLMGMASFSDDLDLVRNEFYSLKKLFDTNCLPSTLNCQLSTLSMGMSGDYKIAL
jgi:pyridoxal phosphate enzyme (YggS family)